MIDHTIAAQTSLVPSVGFPVCPEQEVVLTCTASGSSQALQWRITTLTEVLTRNYLASTAQTNVVTMLGPFQAVLISTGPLTSTLTTTAQTALDGTEVECTGPDVETVTVEVISKSILSSFRAVPATLVFSLGPPSAVINATITVAGQTAGTTSATVTVEWAPSTRADSYTVTVTPDLPSLGGPVTTTGTSLELQDVPYNTPHTVSIVATNCAGSSAATETVFIISESCTKCSTNATI